MQTPNNNQLAHAVEANGAEFLLALGRAGGGQQRRDAQVTWSIGGSPIDYHNAVVAANLAPEQIDQVIDQSRALLEQYRVPGTWHVGPAMRPANLGERLLARGFRYGGYGIGMALPLAQLSEQPALPGGQNRDGAAAAPRTNRYAPATGPGSAGPEHYTQEMVALRDE